MTSSSHKIGPSLGSQQPQVPFFDTLPEDRIILDVLKFLPFRDVLTCDRLDRRFHRVIQDDSLWKMLFAKRFPGAKESENFPFTRENYRRGHVFWSNTQKGLYTCRLLAPSLCSQSVAPGQRVSRSIDWYRISEDNKTVIGQRRERLFLFDVEKHKIFSLNFERVFTVNYLEQNNGLGIRLYGKLNTTCILDIKNKNVVFEESKEGDVFRLKNDKTAVFHEQFLKLFDLRTGNLIASTSIDKKKGAFSLQVRSEVREMADGSIVTLSRKGTMKIWELRSSSLHQRFECVDILLFLETEEGAMVCISPEEVIILPSNGKESRIPLPHFTLQVAYAREFKPGKILLAMPENFCEFSHYVVDIHLKQIQPLQKFRIPKGEFSIAQPLPDPFFKEVCLFDPRGVLFAQKKPCLFDQHGVLQFEQLETILQTNDERVSLSQDPDGLGFPMNEERILGTVFCGPAQVMGLTTRGVALWDFGVSKEAYLSHIVQQLKTAEKLEKEFCVNQCYSLLSDTPILTYLQQMVSLRLNLPDIKPAIAWNLAQHEERIEAITRYLKELGVDPDSVSYPPPADIEEEEFPLDRPLQLSASLPITREETLERVALALQEGREISSLDRLAVLGLFDAKDCEPFFSVGLDVLAALDLSQAGLRPAAILTIDKLLRSLKNDMKPELNEAEGCVVLQRLRKECQDVLAVMDVTLNEVLRYQITHQMLDAVTWRAYNEMLVHVNRLKEGLASALRDPNPFQIFISEQAKQESFADSLAQLPELERKLQIGFLKVFLENNPNKKGIA